MRHCGAAGQAPRRWLLSLWLCNTGHLGTIFGEKKVLMDKSPVGQVWSAAWHVPVASGVECPCRTGGSEGSSCCASCGVSVQLLNTGMCLAGEEKCKKTHFLKNHLSSNPCQENYLSGFVNGYQLQNRSRFCSEFEAVRCISFPTSFFSLK